MPLQCTGCRKQIVGAVAPAPMSKDEDWRSRAIGPYRDDERCDAFVGLVSDLGQPSPGYYHPFSMIPDVERLARQYLLAPNGAEYRVQSSYTGLTYRLLRIDVPAPPLPGPGPSPVVRTVQVFACRTSAIPRGTRTGDEGPPGTCMECTVLPNGKIDCWFVECKSGRGSTWRPGRYI